MFLFSFDSSRRFHEIDWNLTSRLLVLSPATPQIITRQALSGNWDWEWLLVTNWITHYHFDSLKVSLLMFSLKMSEMSDFPLTHQTLPLYRMAIIRGECYCGNNSHERPQATIIEKINKTQERNRNCWVKIKRHLKGAKFFYTVFFMTHVLS